jgi:hypothetical protein
MEEGQTVVRQREKGQTIQFRQPNWQPNCQKGRQEQQETPKRPDFLLITMVGVARGWTLTYSVSLAASSLCDW